MGPARVPLVRLVTESGVFTGHGEVVSNRHGRAQASLRPCARPSSFAMGSEMGSIRASCLDPEACLLDTGNRQPLVWLAGCGD